jgi:glycerate 2-kinase
MNKPEHLLFASLDCAVQAVQAESIIPRALPELPTGSLRVIGAGKAAAAMAAAVERHIPDHSKLQGLVITRHGHSVATQRIRVIEAGHPIPDEQGLRGAREIFDLARYSRPEDSLLVLLSGGGSSLLTLPESGLDLHDVQTVTNDLLRSGAPIEAINCVRKHLSRTLGGKLAALTPARSCVLIISDVVGDDPSVIASGPFYPDPSSFADALLTLEKWQVDVSRSVFDFLMAGRRGQCPETIKPGAPCFERVTTRIIGDASTALSAAAAFFHDQGIETRIIAADITSESVIAASEHALWVRQYRDQGHSRPIALISGGETRVKVNGRGRGGRNSHYLLALAQQLAGVPGVYALAADTDGIDGTEDNAGAYLTPDIWRRAFERGLVAADYLARNDAYDYFAALNALVMTGPTRTNVNDYRVILIT